MPGTEGALSRFEEKIGYSFQSQQLLRLALTHPSWSGEQKKNRLESNQRLEFLGDAVLELTVSEFLYRKHPDFEEGALTRLRASLVFEPALCVCAKRIGLGDFLRLGKGEDSCGGREKPSILSDAFEALIGAVYLDGGTEAAQQFIHRHVLSCVDELSLMNDHKSRLQEIIQRENGTSLRYETQAAESSEEPLFSSVLYINGEPTSCGTGRTKKAAEQNAASNALSSMAEYEEKP